MNYVYRTRTMGKSQKIMLAIVVILFLIIAGGVALLWYTSLGNLNSGISNQSLRTQEAAYVMEKFQNTTLPMPKITASADAAMTEKVNAQIEAEYKTFVCDDGTAFDNVGAVVTYASRDIFSVAIGGSPYCQGWAHPIQLYHSLTFDLITGKQVIFPDLFSDFEKNKRQIISKLFDLKNMVPDENYDSDLCKEYYNIDGRGADYVLPDAYADSSSAAINITRDEYYAGYFDFHISSKGLIVQPASLPFALGICSQNFVVPFTSISQFINPQGILNRLK